MTQRSWQFHISSTVNSLTGLDLKYRYFLLRSYYAQFIGLCFINAIFFFFFFLMIGIKHYIVLYQYS